MLAGTDSPRGANTPEGRQGVQRCGNQSTWRIHLKLKTESEHKHQREYKHEEDKHR